MGWGTLYEIDDSARELLASKRTKVEWYEALDILKVQDVRQFNSQDSIRVWQTVLLGHPGPLGRLFVGALHAFDESDDPSVVFLGRKEVAETAEELQRLRKDYFIELFRKWNPHRINEAWLYEPLKDFLASVQANGKGVLIVWEN